MSELTENQHELTTSKPRIDYTTFGFVEGSKEVVAPERTVKVVGEEVTIRIVRGKARGIVDGVGYKDTGKIMYCVEFLNPNYSTVSERKHSDEPFHQTGEVAGWESIHPLNRPELYAAAKEAFKNDGFDFGN